MLGMRQGRQVLEAAAGGGVGKERLKRLAQHRGLPHVLEGCARGDQLNKTAASTRMKCHMKRRRRAASAAQTMLLLQYTLDPGKWWRLPQE
jgi:hypothetical protein